MTQNIKPMFLEEIKPKTDIRVSILSFWILTINKFGFNGLSNSLYGIFHETNSFDLIQQSNRGKGAHNYLFRQAILSFFP